MESRRPGLIGRRRWDKKSVLNNLSQGWRERKTKDKARKEGWRERDTDRERERKRRVQQNSCLARALSYHPQLEQRENERERERETERERGRETEREREREGERGEWECVIQGERA